MTPQDRPAPTPDSRYLDYLPAIFRTPQRDGTPNILGQVLRAFEDVLAGTGDPKTPGLAERINGIGPPAADGRRPLAGLHRYFEPGPDRSDTERTPREFLDWLAGWVALSLRADIPEETQRKFIANAASLYRLRGTPAGLRKILEIYTGPGVTIDEGSTGYRIFDAGETAVVGKTTVLGGFKPHYFEVTLRVQKEPAKAPAAASLPNQSGASPLEDKIARYRAIATDIIDAEKPAHCFYRLHIISVSLQIGVTSRIGIDTLLAEKHLEATAAGI